jgi:hypothetical protein
LATLAFDGAGRFPPFGQEVGRKALGLGEEFGAYARAVWWNWFGILDLVVATATAVLTQ